MIALRYLRAFAWLRWRLFLNAFKGSRRRDSLERFSRAGAAILPIVLGLIFVPAFLMSGVLAVIGGWMIGSGGDNGQVVLVILRLLLAVITFTVILAPIMRSIRGAASGLSRFVLLPIPKGMLYFSDVVSGLSDPWIALVVPLVLLLPVGLAASGAVVTAALALAGGIGMLWVLLALESSVAHLLGLLYRNRRRGEAVTLVVLILLSVAGFMPAMFSTHSSRRSREARARQVEGPNPSASARSPRVPLEAEEKETGGESPLSGQPARPYRGEAQSSGKESAPPAPGATESRTRKTDDALAERIERRRTVRREPPWWMQIVPSELYARTVSRSAAGRPATGALALCGLGLIGAALLGVSWSAYVRLLETPETGSSSRTGGRSRLMALRIPGLSPGASAIAFAHVRLITRTVHGKMAIYFTPLSLLLVGFVILHMGGGELNLKGSIGSFTGPAMAMGGMIISLLALQKMMLNQFAIDGAGLTLELLSPLSDEEIVGGKTAGMAVLFAGPGLLYPVVAASILAPGGSVWLWGAVALAAISAFLLFAPVAAMLSAVFPKPVNLSSIGSAGNPNGFAAFIGLFVSLGTFAPPIGLGLMALLVFRSAFIALVIVALWTLVAAALAWPLIRLVSRVFAARRENLALVAQGR